MKSILNNGRTTPVAVGALTASLFLLSACGPTGGRDAGLSSAPTRADSVAALPEGHFITDAQGRDVEGTPLDVKFRLTSVGEQGAEPSIGITSSGCMFFTAFEKVMRSCDHGTSWESVEDVFSQPGTSDPYLWVDPLTDRIFNVQMLNLAATWIAWSDDDGESWLGNPYDNGPIPVNDHIKLGSGPWTAAGYGALGNMTPIYDTATYFCYNKLVGAFCYTSLDGGVTFPLGAQVIGLASTAGGLHGAITTAPDGTVYLPPRTSTPTVVVSKDNGLSWNTVTMGTDVNTPNPRKNSEVGTDSASNAYHVWVGQDMGVYLSRSTDSGETWDERSLRVSPKAIVSSTFPHIDAGDPGRIAVAYLGSEDADLIRTPNIDDQLWDGNPHTAPGETVYYLYVTFSLNALDENPVFHTVRVSDDPVQRGSICISSGDCRDIGPRSNRNLLDFNDLHIDKQGRIYIAFADGCTGDCVASGSAEDSRDSLGMVAILDTGPGLFEALKTLPPLE